MSRRLCPHRHPLDLPLPSLPSLLFCPPSRSLSFRSLAAHKHPLRSPHTPGRVELFALLLARHTRIPAIVVKGGDGAPFMLSPTEALPRAPGIGIFTCCARDHLMTDDDGEQRTIPCDKVGFNLIRRSLMSFGGTVQTVCCDAPQDNIARVVLQMLEKRREYYLGSGELLHFRMWSAISHRIMQGLSQSGIVTPPATVAEFLIANRFNSAHENEKSGSGFGPLMFASMQGNVAVVRELITTHNTDVNARILSNEMNADFGLEKGDTALGMAAFFCPELQVCDTVSVLLEAGADPNSKNYGIGATPLMGAVVGQSLEAIRALLASDKIDLEVEMTLNHATALNMAGYLGTYDIVKALILAGANKWHRNDNGGFILSDMAHNPIADPSWFDLVCGSFDERRSGAGVEEYINLPVMPLNLKWKSISFACRTILRLGISRSDIIMGLAHDKGGTPLACAARQGNLKVVRWLLNNGALKSIRYTNQLGFSALDLSRIFGPHREVSTAHYTMKHLIPTVFATLFNAPFSFQVEDEIGSVMLDQSSSRS